MPNPEFPPVADPYPGLGALQFPERHFDPVLVLVDEAIALATDATPAEVGWRLARSRRT